MTTQTALVIQKIGAPITAVNDWPIPQPGPKQIQIRVTVTALNPHDQKGRDLGLFVKDDLPNILGSDIVGVVTVCGQDATRFNVGDRVFGQGLLTAGSASKGLQQYSLLDEVSAALVPTGFSDDECVTLPTNVLAGIVGFFDADGLGLPAPWNTELDYSPLKDSQILIVGGGSNCGRFATQLASLAGFGTIIVVGGQEEELKTFGATHIIDRHGGQYVIVQQIRDVAGDELMYAFDAINGPPNHHLAINALSSSKRGKLARIVHSRGVLDESSIHPKKAGYELKNISGISSLKPGVAIPFWKNVERYLVQGDIRPSKYAIHRGLDAQAVNEVLDRYRDGKVVAQTHFHISE